MIHLWRELQAYGTAVAAMGNFDFTQADRDSQGTRAAGPIKGVIIKTTNYINEAAADEDRLRELLENYDIDPGEDPRKWNKST